MFLRANSFIFRKARDSMVWLGVAIRRKFERLRGQKEVIIRNKVWRMVLRLGVAVRQTIDRLLGPEEIWGSTSRTNEKNSNWKGVGGEVN